MDLVGDPFGAFAAQLRRTTESIRQVALRFSSCQVLGGPNKLTIGTSGV